MGWPWSQHATAATNSRLPAKPGAGWRSRAVGALSSNSGGSSGWASVRRMRTSYVLPTRISRRAMPDDDPSESLDEGSKTDCQSRQRATFWPAA